MMLIKIRRSLTRIMLFVLFALISCNGEEPLPEDSFYILWPDGVIPYKFTDEPGAVLNRTMKSWVREMMDIWENALEITDPLDNSTRRYIRFEECGDNCEDGDSYVLIKRTDRRQNMCSFVDDGVEKLGVNPNGETILRFNGEQPRQVVLHELGHCLGLWHEQNRSDRRRWLRMEPTPRYCAEEPDRCTDDYWNISTRNRDLLPLLNNYDYDSIMHYSSYFFELGEVRWRDHLGNAFLGLAWESDSNPTARELIVSKRDISRVLQYYAHERYPGWGFFTSLNALPADPESLPNPYLAGRVRVEGSPAIAFQSAGNFDIFVRGSDNHLYWKAFRDDMPSGWASLGCCYGSEPSAVSPSNNQIDLVAVDAETGNLMHRHLENADWGDARVVHGGHPVDGIKQDRNGEYIGPAIASREAGSLDVFVVRSDGLLSGITFENGEWGNWTTLRGDYNVTARPAAVALSATQVQLAINESDDNLYEPLLRSDQLPYFSLGAPKGTTAYQAPPTLARRMGEDSQYQVLITNADGRISYRLASGEWLDIGGIPQPGTGPSAVATGNFKFVAVMNGEDATGCVDFCIPWDAPHAGGSIQPGGLWIRHFN